jgi:hypothetical protein
MGRLDGKVAIVTAQIMGVDGGILSHAPYYSELAAHFSA